MLQPYLPFESACVCELQMLCHAPPVDGPLTCGCQSRAPEKASATVPVMLTVPRPYWGRESTLPVGAPLSIDRSVFVRDTVLPATVAVAVNECLPSVSRDVSMQSVPT